MAERQYPAVVYSKDSTTTVQSQKEFEALPGTWYSSPADVPELAEKAHPITGQVPAAPYAAAVAATGALPAPIGPNATERDRLVFQATGIGLKVDKRWSNETLRRQIFETASA